MKFLLVAINAKYIHSNLGVFSLKAYVEEYCKTKNKIEIEIAEYTINQRSEDIVRDIFERQPDAIGFSSYIWNIDMVNAIANDYKKICPDTDIWAGGPEVSYNIEQVLKNNRSIDYIMYGEGEEIFKNVIETYNKTDNFSEIKGVAYRINNDIVINPPQPPIDMSAIPFAYNDIKDLENKIIYYETSRGCPFSCSYCLSSIDKKLRFRDIDIVKKEIIFFINHRVPQVKFVDRTFNCNPDRAMEIWQFIKDNDNGITNFHFEIAADLMNDKEIAMISDMRPGLIQLEIGVQTTNDKTLSEINRKTSINKISEVTEKIQQQKNIHQHLDLIAGLPYENLESFEKSFNQVYSMKPDQLQLGFLKVLHGSEMERRAEEFGIVYSSKPPYEVLKTKWLSYRDIMVLKMVEDAVEIYYNSFQFENTIFMLEKEYESPFKLYLGLGEYYKKNSPNGEKHSRIDRYKILFNYIEKNVKESCMNYYRESLTVDFYLRDNTGSRPPFASDNRCYKKEVQKLYKSDEIRKILPGYELYDSKQLEKMTHVEMVLENTLSHMKLSCSRHSENRNISQRHRYILFDYRKRSPLNKQAKIIDVTEWIKKND